MHLPGLIVFAATYALISARRVPWLGLDRSAAAVVGAVAAVLVGALSPAEALGAVDGATLLLLFSVMGIGAFVARDDLFGALEARWLDEARSPLALLGSVVWLAGAGSALVTNDAVCVLAAPLVVRLVRRRNLPPAPYLLALATGSNTGSVATLIGNPQNMLCGVLGGLEFREHLALLGPVAVVGLALNHAVLWFAFRNELRGTEGRAQSPDRPTASPAEPDLRSAGEASPLPLSRKPRSWLTLGVLGATVVAYALGGHLAWTAATGFAALLLFERQPSRELWTRIDWALLAFFAGLFVVVEAFTRSGVPERLFSAFPLWDTTATAAANWARLSTAFLVGSNLVSNVPFVLVVREHLAAVPDTRLAWELLAMASTFAGNLTLLGSVANIIVAEAGRDVGGLGFFQYLKVGAPIALLTTAFGTAWLVALAA
jgi:Na+/H+ antiporter NhaD/arsenite permease-like protein